VIGLAASVSTFRVCTGRVPYQWLGQRRTVVITPATPSPTLGTAMGSPLGLGHCPSPDSRLTSSTKSPPPGLRVTSESSMINYRHHHEIRGTTATQSTAQLDQEQGELHGVLHATGPHRRHIPRRRSPTTSQGGGLPECILYTSSSSPSRHRTTTHTNLLARRTTHSRTHNTLRDLPTRSPSFCLVPSRESRVVAR
jgi:hypothetical protein